MFDASYILTPPLHHLTSCAYHLTVLDLNILFKVENLRVDALRIITFVPWIPPFNTSTL